MKRTNFDRYLEDQLSDPEFKRDFIEAGKAWDVALQLTQLRENAGMTQRELARRVGTTQQQISRLESSGYSGHSLSMLRRVAHALDAQLVVGFTPNTPTPTPRSGAFKKPTQQEYRVKS